MWHFLLKGVSMKFNESKKTLNHEGQKAYAMKPKELLVSQVLTSFFNEDKFYGDNSNELVENATKMAKSDPQFLASLAIYARNVYHLRSVSHVLTCIVAHEAKKYTKITVENVCERADDLTEILACYLSMYDKPIPNALKKALAKTIGNFDTYQISKYNGGNKQISFKDVLKLTHPVPTPKTEKLFSDIMNDTLPVAVRWETELSAHGNNKGTWERLIEENKLGYMAMLRNLRNILNAQPRNINKVFDKLSDKTAVLKSKQLPFRFLSAYKEVSQLMWPNKATVVLEDAISYSVENLPKLKGTTVIAYDISGSMCDALSKNSKVRCCDVSALLAVLASRICEDFVVYAFSDSVYRTEISSRDAILSMANRLSKCMRGTNMSLPISELLENNIYADRIIFISDNECNQLMSDLDFGYRKSPQKLLAEYRNRINKDVWLHAIDLQGYGTQQFVGNKVNYIAGWSERTLEFISIVEKGLGSQVEKIEDYMIWAKPF
jgi:hypothetical protein